MLDHVQLRALVIGILAADNATKQRLGQRFARSLGLTPGPSGADDGIDGLIEIDGKKVHFQCKLRSTPLDRDDARSYYSDLIYHHCTASIILAAGFKATFHERLFGHPGIEAIRIHLLTLDDLFLESAAFKAARADLPALSSLAEVMKSPS